MFTLQSALRDYTLSKATITSVGFDNISSMEQMWTWMDTTLLDLLFPRSVWYNGDPLPQDKRGFLLEVFPPRLTPVTQLKKGSII
jgi:hypothetical protein